MDRIPKSGECYRHFKNKLYQIVTVAIHSETGEKMVVYQALYGSFLTYVRPLSMFMSEVDHDKYPNVKQKYRFEKVDVSALEDNSGAEEGADSDSTGTRASEAGKPVTVPDPEKATVTAEAEPVPSISNENLLAFLEVESYHDKLEVLKARRGKFTLQELTAVCESLDVGAGAEDEDEKYRAAENFLTMQAKYDGARLR